MEQYNKDKKVKLFIDDKLLDKLTTVGIKNYPNECGGFLVGYYSDDFMILNVTDFIMPQKFKGSHYSFTRSIIGIKEIFNKIFQLKRHYYIGEWHTHPNGSSTYSTTDLNAMIEIANCDTVSITNPILLILGIEKQKMNNFSFYIYNNKGLYKYG